jgi:hypothetical protein
MRIQVAMGWVGRSNISLRPKSDLLSQHWHPLVIGWES